MATYYATVKIEGTYSFQDITVQAQNDHEAKKIIEMRLGSKSEKLAAFPHAGIKAT